MALDLQNSTLNGLFQLLNWGAENDTQNWSFEYASNIFITWYP